MSTSPVTVKTDPGSDELFELGSRAPNYRYVRFTVEFTCSIEVTRRGGRWPPIACDGGRGPCGMSRARRMLWSIPVDGTNLKNDEIVMQMREGAVVDLENRNKLASLTYGGGDAGGGNAIMSFNFSNYNSISVQHPHDPAGV